MNQIFFITFIFFVLLTTVNAAQPYRCVDSNGNKFITTNPRDGMKCETGESNEEPSSPKIVSKSKDISPENLEEKCINLYRESEEISDEIKSFDPRLSELQKEQFNIRQQSIRNNWSQKDESEATKPSRDEQHKINQEISLLYQKQSLINNDIRIYKCVQLKQDLSRLNQGNATVNNPSSQENRNRNRTVIMRGGGRSLIYRD